MLDVCLRTLLECTGVELEIVVVLNGCDEELPEVATSSDRVHVTRAEPPVGFSAANNFGVRWADDHLGRPDYYYFVNNDTRSWPDSLELMVAALEDDERAAVAGPTLLIDWAQDHLNSLCLNVTDDAWGWDEGIGISLDAYGPLPGRRPVTAVTGSAILVDAAVHHEVGGWTELYDYYFEDIDLCLKVRSAGYEVIHEPAAIVGHHVSATMTLESDYKVYLFHRNRLLLALVHWPPGMLMRLLKIALIDEILRRPRAESGTRRRALAGAVRKLPRALGARWRTRRRASWVDLLVPRGSVPVITLPQREGASEGESQPPRIDPETWDAARELEPATDGGRRVLIVGCSPLPFENQRMNHAPGARTWQFAEALAGDGHAVCVVTMRIPGAYTAEGGPVEVTEHDGVPIFAVEHELFRRPGVVEQAAAAFRPEVVIGASSALPGLRAVEVAGGLPVWVDLFGDLLAEAQARLSVHPDEDLAAYRDLLATLLERGDAFSAVSDRQRYCVMGQLGLVGRLNRWTRGHGLVHAVPCSLPDATPEPRPELVAAAASEFDADDVVLLWGGGFNTWCDVDTLVDGVERAMAANPRLRLVATGGPIPGHDDLTYDRFADRVARSESGDRFVVKGQLGAEEAAAVRRRADLGIVTEKDLVERALGSSGRVLQWIRDGLPVVCTQASELGSLLAGHGLAATYRVGDADDLARVILDAADDLDAARERAARALRYGLEHWSTAATTAPLRAWAEHPVRAADAAAENPLSTAVAFDAARRVGGLEVELDAERARFHELRSELGRIHQSRMWRIWMSYLRFTGWLRPRPTPPPAADDDQ